MRKTLFANDNGNENNKLVAHGSGVVLSEISFPSSIINVSKSEYDSAMRRTGSKPDDFYIVNGRYFVSGRTAQRMTKGAPVARGAGRYTPEDYGVRSAIAMSKLLDPKEDVTIATFMGAFPPEDERYASDLTSAVIGKWDVKSGSKHHEITIPDGDAYAMDEPLTAYYALVMNKDGTFTRDYRKKYVNSSILIVDGGGYTIDTIVVDANAEVDYSTASTYKGVAVQAVVSEFKKDIDDLFKTQLKGSELTMSKYYDALSTGIVNLGTFGDKNVSKLARDYRQTLLKSYLDTISMAGGQAEYDTILFTGGASGLIYSELVKHFAGQNIAFSAQGDMKNIHLANARGLHRFMLYAINQKWVS